MIIIRYSISSVLFFLFLFGNAAAKEPKWVSFNGLLLDTNNIIKNGSAVRIWTAGTSSYDPFDYFGKIVKSHKLLTEINCDYMTQQLIEDFWMDDISGKGNIVSRPETKEPSDISPIIPGSYPFAKIVDYVCDLYK